MLQAMAPRDKRSALADAIAHLRKVGKIKRDPLHGQVAAVSVGIYNGVPVLDLDYPEDSSAGTDANFVMTGSGGIVEIQGTAEGEPFSEATLGELLAWCLPPPAGGQRALASE